MINIKNMGTLKNLTRAMSNQGYDLVKMIYDGEFNELNDLAGRYLDEMK